MEDNLNINLNYINSIGSSITTPDGNGVDNPVETYDSALTKEVEKLKKSLLKRHVDSDLAPHVSSLIDYYAELGAAEQQVFISNAFA